jgi:hypothetical protein
VARKGLQSCPYLINACQPYAEWSLVVAEGAVSHPSVLQLFIGEVSP